ncbi:4'-phosphopantetheinyl transferase family protein [Streptomyces qinzhouensis]|uniref:4'-phosphopantetheinyl transferase superfamily protein n=1 Tax=Streptomyces qinzhouensis TaxID=2599401 RepID=A0A5B8JFL3_9ACTN|nr:4'-phosphopantetheinyl transferase superfamily protein [Streptomyces qinzhouensis]QDY75213.1 4'-phosphopantetheinyl transferase superfamily protein [Streptomyces qinzhouensis]QDY80585.1 4'-phosphopantetheinyl transferase superfamily protein [Streptomyces qinzhouensis]
MDPPPRTPQAPHHGHRLPAPRIPGLITLMGRAHPADGTGTPAEDTWRTVMSPAEHRRADAFRLDTDRHQFQYTRWLLRTGLSRLAPVAPQDWEFVATPHGKPAIHPRFGSDVQFSLSHSGGLCLIGLAHGRPVGVDIQTCEALSSPQRVARLAGKCLAPAERTRVDTLTGREQRDAVIQLWTLKEAYAKAVGLGLRLPFDQIAFRPDHRRGIVLQPTATVRDPGRWDCWAPPPPPGFRMAVCLARPGPDGPR